MINRKSQAALEFLMTYGWAILVVLVAVGALAYFGVLSPDRFLPSKCTLSPGLACIDHKATVNSLEVVIQNSLGSDITVNSVKASRCTEKTSLGTLANGAQLPLTGAGAFTCTNSGISKYSGDLNVTYTTSSDLGGVQHTNRGQITSRIE